MDDRRVQIDEAIHAGRGFPPFQGLPGMAKTNDGGGRGE